MRGNFIHYSFQKLTEKVQASEIGKNMKETNKA